jgi:hypothetical protein
MAVLESRESVADSGANYDVDDSVLKGLFDDLFLEAVSDFSRVP